MTAREIEERRRRRVRREDLERQRREWVVGGPLVDIGKPVMGGGSGAHHADQVNLELKSRGRRVREEAALLAYDFARRCLIPLVDRDRMREQWCAWHDAFGPPGPIPSHSTARETMTLTGRTIPRL